MPEELLAQVLGRLIKDDLQSARGACRAFNRVIVESFVKCITVTAATMTRVPKGCKPKKLRVKFDGTGSRIVVPREWAEAIETLQVDVTDVQKMNLSFPSVPSRLQRVIIDAG